MSREHGTRARYVFGPGPGKGAGCRCDPCTAANRQEGAHRSRQRAYGQWAPYVDAQPAREHARQLAGHGIVWKRVAALAGVSTGAMSKLLYGGPGQREPSRRIRPETAAAILAVRPEAASLAPSAVVDATGSHRRLQALVAGGWCQAKLAGRLGMTSANFGACMGREQVTASTAQAVRSLYGDLWDQVPPESGQREKIAAARARNYARTHGWAPPAAWDDDVMDDPGAPAPEGWQRPASGRLRTAELAEDASELLGQGFTREHAAGRLGVSRAAIEKALSRTRDTAEQEHEAQRAMFAGRQAMPGTGARQDEPETEREAG
ncbi:MAG: hypothetical protein ACRDPY_04040 [Streptosporangiaceae bacterium]